MTKFLTTTLSALFIVCLLNLPGGFQGAHARDFDVSSLSKEQQDSWSKIQAQLKQELSVCSEHCGGNKDCLAKCQTANEARRERAYERLASVQGDKPPKNDMQMAASCPFCGMNREQYAHSRAFIEYDDGSLLGTCSIHCAGVDMAVNIDKTPMKIWVGDYRKKHLIDAENAVWVIGGNKMGVMTKRAKWAFETKEAAEQFVKEEGGKVASFDDAMKAAFEDMYDDTRMIRERRKAKRMMQK